MCNKSIITCREHGDFEQIVLNHLAGKGCKKCPENSKKEKIEILEKLNLLHNNKYDYSLSDFKRTRDSILIICPKHKEFKQTLNNHLSGRGCPFCDESRGERVIEKYLIENNIVYERQKKFEYCKDKNKLPFDFYLIDYNTLIEYDGEQHFHEVLNWGNFEITKKHDIIKNKFCKLNEIKLCRISYIENINEKLKIELKNNIII
jgi:hypothetical protein